jgi:hypothetical protein
MTTKIQTFGGNIGIGTNDPGVFKLNVNGSLKTSSLVVNGVTDAQVPIGLIQLWYGSSDSIPSGWALCDGGTYPRTDGVGDITTPDLKTKFIRGATGNTAPSPLDVGTIGGDNNVTLSVANLAPHNHGVTVSDGNAPHGHGTTGTGNAPHDHPLAQNNAPHNHVAQTNNANHNHGLDQADAPHNHNAYAEDGAAHNHNVGDASLSPHTHQRPLKGLTGPSPRYNTQPLIPQSSQMQSWRNNRQRSGGNNVPHYHILDATPGQQHSHNTNASQMNHYHGVGANNTQHSHTATGSAAMLHSHTLGQGGVEHSHNAPNVNAPHGHEASSSNTGEATPFSVLNEYYALFYIMKI